MFTTAFDYGRTVERLRLRAGDDSRVLPTTEAPLRIDISPECEHAAHLTMHDGAGDHVFDAEAYATARIKGTAQVPVGISWYLTLYDGGGIDFDQGRQGWGVRIGEVQSTGALVVVKATFDCAAPSGSGVAGGSVLSEEVLPDLPEPSPDRAIRSTSPAPSGSEARGTTDSMPARDGSVGLVVGALAVIGLLGAVVFAVALRQRSQ